MAAARDPSHICENQFARRSLLIGVATSMVAAPAIVRAESLMPVRAFIVAPPIVAGFVERLSYRWMENVLKKRWTPERASGFYSGISEDKMRSMVAYARRHGLLN